MTDYAHGDIIPYSVNALGVDGQGITNANMVIQHFRKSDNQFWNGAAWQVARFDIPMIENADTVNFPGRWTYDFDTNPHNLVDDYYSQVVDLSGNAVNAPFQLIHVPLLGHVDSIINSLVKITGLAMNNFVMDPTDYDTQGRMTEGQARLYDSAANALTDDGSTGILFKYDIVSDRTISGFLAKYTQTLVP